MPQSDNTPRGNNEDASVTRLSLVEDLHPTSHANLTRGIVWADILADIAAYEASRQYRDAA